MGCHQWGSGYRVFQGISWLRPGLPGDNELLKVMWHFMGLGGVEFTFLAAPGGICGYGCISMGLYLGGQAFYMVPSVTSVTADGGLVLQGGYWCSVFQRVVQGNVSIGAAALGVVGVVLFIHCGRAYMGGFIAQQSSGNFDHPSLHKGGFPFKDILLLEEPSFRGGGGKSGVALCNDPFGNIGRVGIVVVELDEPVLVSLCMGHAVSFVEAAENLVSSQGVAGAA
jgi:hypothetical protein